VAPVAVRVQRRAGHAANLVVAGPIGKIAYERRESRVDREEGALLSAPHDHREVVAERRGISTGVDHDPPDGSRCRHRRS
jgi:hypothetical protein